MGQKQYRLKPRITAAAILIIIGAVLAIFAVGHLYLGLACIFFGAVILVYTWFHFAVNQYPRFVKGLRLILSIFLIIGVLYFAFLEFLILSDAKTDTDREADYIIVLGAGVNGTTPSLSLRNRLYAAWDYMEAHPNVRAVVSGGQGPGEDITEAQCMRDFLVEKGIDENRIFMETQATSTEENLRYSMEIIRLQSSVRDPVIGIVSSEYHLHRAKLMARQYDIDAVGVAAQTSYVTLTMNYCIREAFGLTHYYVFGY